MTAAQMDLPLESKTKPRKRRRRDNVTEEKKTEKAFAKHVESNVKGLLNHDLEPCTLIVGENRSGKSRVVDSLSLALTGTARSAGLGKREIDLMTLKPLEDTSLRSRVDLSDGTVLRWTAEGTTAKAKRAEWLGQLTDREGETAIHTPVAAIINEEAQALLRGDPKRIRAALLSRLGAELPTEELKGKIPAELWDDWCGATDDTPGVLWDIDAILATEAALKKRKTAQRKELKLAEEVLEDEPEPLSPDEIEEFEALAAASARTGMTEEQINSMRARRDNLDADIRVLAAEVAAMQPPPGALDHATVTALKQARDVNIWLRQRMSNAGVQQANCACCGTKGVALRTLEDCAGAIGGILARSQDSLAQIEGQERKAAGLRALKADRNALSKQLNQATLAEPVDQGRLAELERRQGAIEQRARAAETKVACEKAIQTAESLQATAKRIVGDLLDSRVEGLEKRINAFLPRGTNCSIKLRDGSRDVCQIALKTGKDPARDLRALSGAERTLLVTAFASALLGDEHVNMIVIDEVWFDPKRLRELCKTLRKAVESDGGPGQAIVCAVSYKGKAPEGWKLIRLGEEE